MKARSVLQQAGFTLVEAVIALLLLGIATVIIIKLNGQLFANGQNLTTWQSDTQLLQACVDRVIGLRKTQTFSYFDTTSGANSGCYGLNSRLTVTVSSPAPACPTPIATPASGANCKQLNIKAAGFGSTVTLLIADY
jgi:Tfp pilus assembly protein PilV